MAKGILKWSNDDVTIDKTYIVKDAWYDEEYFYFDLEGHGVIKIAKSSIKEVEE